MSESTPLRTPDAHAALPACMGGWCTHRDHCALHIASWRAIVVERLCQRGLEQAVPIQAWPELSARMPPLEATADLTDVP